MARIGKDQHPRILQLVDTEHRKVAEVAAEYGCTPANIYALLSKLRRDVASGAEAANTPDGPAGKVFSPDVEDVRSPQAAGSAVLAVPDLFALDPTCGAPHGRRRNRPAVAPADVTGVKTPEPAPMPPLAAVPQTGTEVFSLPAHSVVKQMPPPGTAKKGQGFGAKLAKPGVALMMRTAEGEENLTPFRSLDDLLSAVKPILRAAARSPDAVWFSIQPVDLASLDSDAA